MADQELLQEPQIEPPVEPVEAVAPVAPAVAPASLFSTYERVQVKRSPTSTAVAVVVHAAVILLIVLLIAKHVQLAPPTKTTLVTDLAPPPPAPPKAQAMGGGGGQKSPTPVTQGHLPKLAQEQIIPPKAPPTIPPKLAVDPTVVVQKDLKMADNKMPNLGMPNSNLQGMSMGNGNGSGIGSGNGNGIGPGSGGNMGGGVYKVGGGVSAPTVKFSVDPEFSEEARKAKFSGDVVVSLIIDENGMPSHVQVERGVGMGLDEKAVEAVRQYRFHPAILNGKPVKCTLNMDVNFQIF